MLDSVIDALERRQETIDGEREIDKARVRHVSPALTGVANLLAKIVENVDGKATSPEEAYGMLRKSVVDVYQELVSSINEMKNADIVWKSRKAELSDILSDLKKLSEISKKNAAQEQVENADQEAPPAVNTDVTVRADVARRPRGIGERPVGLRQARAAQDAGE